MNFAQARYQSSAQGRFTSVDPLGASASVGNPQSFNRYSYVENDPVNATDPTGMMLVSSPMTPNSAIGVYQTSNPEVVRRVERAEDQGVKNWMAGGTNSEEESEEQPPHSDSDSSGNAPQDVVTVSSASLDADSEKISGTITDYDVTFALTTDVQMQQVFGGSVFQVQLNLFLPTNATSLTSTTATSEKIPGAKDSRSTGTQISGSTAKTPPGSNFRAGSHPPGHPGIASVSFSNFKTTPNATAVAKFTLFARGDSATASNFVSVRIEGKTNQGQIFRTSIRVSIVPIRTSN